VTAIILDVAVLVALLCVKASSGPLVISAALTGMLVIFAVERMFLRVP